MSNKLLVTVPVLSICIKGAGMLYKSPVVVYTQIQTNSLFLRKMHTKFLKDTFIASVNAVQPHILIKGKVHLCGRHLVVNGSKHELRKPCFMVGFGKAVHRMALEMQRILGTNLQRAIVVVPKGTFGKKCKTESNVEFVEGAERNLPDLDSMRGAEEIKTLVEALKEDDLLLVLISGGGSALLPLPKPPITLEEKLSVVKSLSKSGADICELNCVRKQLSLLKGGGLAELAHPAKVVSLILSDIIGDPLDFIASGPTVPNLDEPEMAIEILKRYYLYDSLPISIKRVLQFAASPKSKEYDHVTNHIIGNNMIAAMASQQFAEDSGIQSAVVSTEVHGDVHDIANVYVELARKIREVHMGGSKNNLENYLNGLKWKLYGIVEKVLEMDFRKDVCLIFAGEPTVVVEGSGLGGRNQHLALAFSLSLEDIDVPADAIWLLSAGTDGADGPTDAAGAIGGKGVGLEAKKYLEDNDSYGFFKSFRRGERLVITGQTGTNVMDIHVLLVRKV